MLHIPLMTLHAAMYWMFKLGQCAEKSWHKLRGFAHLADVIRGVDFVNSFKPSTQDKVTA